VLDSLPYRSASANRHVGLLHALESVATLLLMWPTRRDLGTASASARPHRRGRNSCLSEAKDLRATPEILDVGEKEFFEPNLYLFDAYPGGIGFSEPLYRGARRCWFTNAGIDPRVPCEQGCPSCVGPAGDLAPRAKEAALAILDVCG